MWTKLRAVIFFCETAVVSNAFLRNWLTRLISSRMPDVRPLCSHKRTQRHKVCGDLLDAVKLATEDVIAVKQQHIRRKAFEIQHYWCHEFSKECPNILPCHISSQRDDENKLRFEFPTVHHTWFSDQFLLLLYREKEDPKWKLFNVYCLTYSNPTRATVKQSSFCL